MAHNGSQGQEPTIAAPTNSPALDDEMLEGSGSDSNSLDGERNNANQAKVQDLKQQLRIQARQIAAMQEIIAQMAGQLIATPNERVTKPKMATPKKYKGGQHELRTFLTNINLYYGFNRVLNNQEKILTASMHMKGKAASWMQPYVEDFLAALTSQGIKAKTKTLFQD